MNQLQYRNLYQLKNSWKINSYLNFHIMIKTRIENKKRQTIELTIGDIACFVKPHSDFVCDTIVRGILPKRHNGLRISYCICIGY